MTTLEIIYRITVILMWIAILGNIYSWFKQSREAREHVEAKLALFEEREKIRVAYRTNEEQWLALTDRLRERAELAERKVEAVKNMVEAEKHYNLDCGWDVPAIRVYDALEGKA